MTTFVAQVEEYLALRRGLGERLVGQGTLLLDFGHFLDRTGHRGPLTVDIALQWAQPPCSKDPDQTARRLGTLRRFLRHRAAFDPANEVPPTGLLGCGIRRKPPHIYSEAEVEALLDAVTRLRPRGGLRCCTYATLFRLLLCTGLRISEALQLEDRDVDLGSGVLTVRNGKFGKSRLVPLHPSTLAPLRQYVAFRDTTAPPSNFFWRTDKVAHLGYVAVRMTFNGLRERLGWTAEGRARRPRLHDMRHTFAVRRLVRWYRDGIDIDRRMAHLATYFGHVEVRDTYWYLSAVPELTALAGERFELHVQRERERCS